MIPSLYQNISNWIEMSYAEKQSRLGLHMVVIIVFWTSILKLIYDLMS